MNLSPKFLYTVSPQSNDKLFCMNTLTISPTIDKQVFDLLDLMIALLAMITMLAIITTMIIMAI